MTNTITTLISEENTGIRIKAEGKIGTILLVDEQNEDEPIQQLQFNSERDLDYFLEQLNELKKLMEGG